MNKKIKCTLKILNDLIEFRTSIGIITSVTLGTGYAFYRGGSFHPLLFLAMITAAILLDGAATVFNHFFDYLKSSSKSGYLYNIHNPITYYELNPLIAFAVGAALIGIAGLLGIYLILSTSWVLLFLGVLSMMIAFFYSAGKHPISYTPFGEIVSGLFEGSMVFCISFFIQYGTFSYHVFLASLPVALSIANIMLSNNTSDVDEDREDGRRTLPVVIGQDSGIKVLYASHVLMFFLIALYSVTGLLPPACLAVYMLLPLVTKNLKTFNQNRTKAGGFVFVLKNTIFFNAAEIAAIWFTAIIRILS